MKLEDVRKIFIDYFKEKGHTVVPSSSLVVRNDPTLLFANAGMNQFKDVFLGLDSRDYNRATSCQKCVRAGGKHNDLENVGFTCRHHTFFEMLGNFSFGDYSKKEAIQYAWDLLTNYYKIPTERLYVSVYTDDDEAYDIWHKHVGIPKEKIYRFGEKDNYWSMAEYGPCGPCSEIFYDHGEEHGCGKKDCTVGCDCDRFVEIWNLVFMQFNRDESGNVTKLPKPSVDTGAGLERLTAVMQGVASNYDIDIFKALKNEISKDAKIDLSSKKAESSYNVVSDHLRCIAFLISDGCFPSNEGAGYVLRRIIRRGVRHGKSIGFDSPFLYKKIGKVVELMGNTYTELKESKKEMEKILRIEEERFYETLDKGLNLLEKELSSVKKGGTLRGEIAFKLYDTYGFPLDLTELISRERGIGVDKEGFDSQMDTQREMARTARGRGAKGDFYMKQADIELLKKYFKEIKSEFIGYEGTESESKCTHIIKDGRFVDRISDGEAGIVIFDKTPFYAKSGGQTGDCGFIKEGDRKIADIKDVQKPVGDIHLHFVDNVDKLEKNKKYKLEVDFERRRLVERNHTATHMLHYLLRKHLGEHVKQAGSNVNPEFFSFDFTHYEKISDELIITIEHELNEWILKGDEVSMEEMSYKAATSGGAIALFDEKYSDKVRVVRVGDSAELCGGTHAKNIAEIGIFKIISEESIGSGLRRIKAITSLNAYSELSERYRTVEKLSSVLRLTSRELPESIANLLSENRDLRKENERLKLQTSKSSIDDVIKNLTMVGDMSLIFSLVEGATIKDLKEYIDYIRDRIGKNKAVAVLYSSVDDSLAYTVYVSKSIHDKITATDIIKFIANAIGGKGGGKTDFAQGGGGDLSKLKTMRNELIDFISTKSGVTS